jgi:hypothetical protein
VSDSWTIGRADERRLISAELCFMGTVGCSCPYERTANSSNNGTYRTVQENWKEHVTG